MTTLLATISEFPTTLPDRRMDEWVRWVTSSRVLLGLGVTGLLVVNNGDERPAPAYMRTHINMPDYGSYPPVGEGRVPCVVIPNYLPRINTHTYPGSWRSYFRIFHVARAYGFGKVIIMQNDFRYFTERFATRFREFASGCGAPWCPKYNTPEDGCIVFCADVYDRVAALEAKGERWFNEIHKDPRRDSENQWPVTTIFRELVGDRYSEYPVGDPRRAIPGTADFAHQVEA